MTAGVRIGPLLLDEPEACRALSVCARTLREARKSGALPYVLIARAAAFDHA